MPNEYQNRKGPRNAEVKWLKASRVAAEMDVSVPTVKTWIAEGKLDAIRLSPNGEWRISRESLTAWQESLRSRCSPRVTTGPVDGEPWPDAAEPAAGS